MQTIKCSLKRDEYTAIPSVGVTPAEVLIYTRIHDPGVNKGAYPKIISPILSGEALTIDKPFQASEDEQYLQGGRTIPAKPEVTAETHVRTDAEEYDRLKRKYTQTLDGDPNKHVVDQVFPGLYPKLPQTFEDIGLHVSEAESAVEVQTKGASTLGIGELKKKKSE